MPTQQQFDQAAEFVRRKQMRASFEVWCRSNLPEGQEPAQHHLVIIKALDDLVKDKLMLPNGQIAKRLIIMLPPGAAKSTYTSWLFPPWFLNRAKHLTILSTSYSLDLVESFGRRCRNLIEQVGQFLGYRLKTDSKAAGQWETTNEGRYFCAGVNAGIAGHRADLGLIDDPIGDEMTADSKLFRDRLWDWYRNDFVPRLKPQAWRVLICNRRHEDDLVGRLLDPKFPANESEDWYVLSIPMEAGEDDVLGRQPGERLWPEWFTPKQVADAKKDPRTWAGLYQQNPTPESGDFFKREWVMTYEIARLPKNLNIYCASDHAVSEARTANKSCLGAFGIDEDYNIWILPDLYWKKASPMDAVNAMFTMVKRLHPIDWTAEKGHISKSLRPLIELKMRELGCFFVLNEVQPTGSKRARCGAIAGMLQQHRVFFPVDADWWPDALFEMMSFTGNGDDKSDDFCDFLGHVGMKVNRLIRPSAVQTQKDEPLNVGFVPTYKWLKDEEKRGRRSAVLFGDK